MEARAQLALAVRCTRELYVTTRLARRIYLHVQRGIRSRVAVRFPSAAAKDDARALCRRELKPVEGLAMRKRVTLGSAVGIVVDVGLGAMPCHRPCETAVGVIDRDVEWWRMRRCFFDVQRVATRQTKNGAVARVRAATIKIACAARFAVEGQAGRVRRAGVCALLLRELESGDLLRGRAASLVDLPVACRLAE